MLQRGNAQQHDVIDLTSDSEDVPTTAQTTGPLLNKKGQGNGNQRSDGGGFAPSNHGLPDPEEFVGSRKPWVILPGIDSPTIDLTSERNTPSQRQAEKQYAPILPGATLQSRRSSQGFDRSTRIYTPILSVKRSGAQANSPAVLPINTVGSAGGLKNSGHKSRQSENRDKQGVGSSGRTSNGQRVENERDGISFTYSPLRPSTQPSGLKKRKVRKPDSHNSGSASRSDHQPGSTHKEPPPILPVRRTIITGASRSTDSTSPRVPPNIEPLPFKNYPHLPNRRLPQQPHELDHTQDTYNTDSQNSRSGHANMDKHRRNPPDGPQALAKGQSKLFEDRKTSLVPQFASHYQSAAAPHKERLPRDKLYEITEQLMRAHVSEDRVQKPLRENAYVFTKAAEEDFRMEARNRVASAVEQYLRAEVSPLAKATNAFMEGIHYGELNHETPTSADSPESLQVFETHELPKFGANLGSRVREGSSPATSYSNSRADSQQRSEAEENDGETGTSGRRTRGQRPVDYRPPWKQNLPKQNVPKPIRRVKQVVEHDGEDKATPSQSCVSRSSSTAPPPAAAEVEVETWRPQRVRKSATQSRVAGTVPKLSASGDTAVLSVPNIRSPRSRLEFMLKDREVNGMEPTLLREAKLSYKTLSMNALEDGMVRDHQWASQSGDAVTITWAGPSTFVSGALTHYDVHNMQYNRHGNLVVGSTDTKLVKMVDGHRTLRPIVTPEENKENALPSMRATQDEWRYASVVSTAYCEANGYTFTASYDKTVKIWKVPESGGSMERKGLWEHDSFVNFVVTSKHHDKVATASEARNDAVRVYSFDEASISQSSYDVYNANRAFDRPGDLRMAESWAYHPATLQWGRSEKVMNLLLVGYSPRAASNHEDAIPDIKKNSGELCCWNVETGEQIHITSGKSTNIFEVIWHPSQPIFLVACAPSGSYDPKRTKTQVRLYQLQGSADFEAFQCMKTLDCPASDVNELTIMPTSMFGGYVTASCTNGRTYVWDTMQDHRVLHVLEHGESIDNPDPNLPLEVADSGVKFAAWGQSGASRFYTGSSDGVVKVWNITKDPARIFVREILRAQGGIACGAFSPDFQQLVIGDATGGLHLIRAPDDDEGEGVHPINLPALPHSRRGFIIPHADPKTAKETMKEISNDAEEEDGKRTGNHYLEEGILREFPVDIPGFEGKKKVGQGPNYAELSLYRDDLHMDDDHNKPLLPAVVKSTLAYQARLSQYTPQPSHFPILPAAQTSLKRRVRTDDDIDFESLRIHDPSEEFRRDLEVSGDCLFDIDETWDLKQPGESDEDEEMTNCPSFIGLK